MRRPALALVIGLLSWWTPAAAGDIDIRDPWARASAGPAGAGAAYFEIRNHGARADRLVSARTEVSRTASLHSHVVKDNIMRMTNSPVGGGGQTPHHRFPDGAAPRLRRK